MPKDGFSREFRDGQMVISFFDLEGDLSYLIRSLELYREAYEQHFGKKNPFVKLSPDDFTIVEKHGSRYIELPKNVLCVNVGDLVDKARIDQKTNIEIIRIMDATCHFQPNRMFNLLGNRETTKIRAAIELDEEYIKKVFDEDLSRFYENQGHYSTGPERHEDHPGSVWIDRGKLSFVDFLIREKIGVQHEGNNLEDQQKPWLETLFGELTSEEKQAKYLKWMLANSCGAPTLWYDFALELGFPPSSIKENNLENEVVILQRFKEVFVNPKSAFVRMLKTAYLGLIIGDHIAFSHGGISDESFNLPKTLPSVLTQSELEAVFGKNVNKGNLLEQSEDNPLKAENLDQLFKALNLWYKSIINQFYNQRAVSDTIYKQFYDNEEGIPHNILMNAINELIAMGLPPEANSGSVINTKFMGPCNTYGVPLTEETYKKITNSKVQTMVQGHQPNGIPLYNITRLGPNTPAFERINGDTKNYREETEPLLVSQTKNVNTASGVVFFKRGKEVLKQILYVGPARRGEVEREEGGNVSIFQLSDKQVIQLPTRNEKGDVLLNGKVLTEQNPEFYIGYRLNNLDESDINYILDRATSERLSIKMKSNVAADLPHGIEPSKQDDPAVGWQIISYDATHEIYRLYKAYPTFPLGRTFRYEFIDLPREVVVKRLGEVAEFKNSGKLYLQRTFSQLKGPKAIEVNGSHLTHLAKFDGIIDQKRINDYKRIWDNIFTIHPNDREAIIAFLQNYVDSSFDIGMSFFDKVKKTIRGIPDKNSKSHLHFNRAHKQDAEALIEILSQIEEPEENLNGQSSSARTESVTARQLYDTIFEHREGILAGPTLNFNLNGSYNEYLSVILVYLAEKNNQNSHVREQMPPQDGERENNFKPRPQPSTGFFGFKNRFFSSGSGLPNGKANKGKGRESPSNSNSDSAEQQRKSSLFGDITKNFRETLYAYWVRKMPFGNRKQLPSPSNSNPSQQDELRTNLKL
jgi:hypothetical protein